MSDREEFMKRNPVPDSAIWCEKKQGYYWSNYPTVAHPFNDKWEVWQEALEYARAQSGQGADADEVYLPFGAASAYADAKEGDKDNMTISCELVVELIDEIYRLNARPRPIKQEGDGWVKCSQKDPTDADGYKVWFSPDGIIYYLLDPLVLAESTRKHGYWKPTGLKRPQLPKEDA